MNKLRVVYRYSVWKIGQGWELEDYVSDEINAYQADGSHDTCYTYSVYKTNTNESYSVCPFGSLS